MRSRRSFPMKFPGFPSEEDLGNGKVQDGHLYANISVAGVNPGYEDVSNVKMIEGSFPEKQGY